MSRVGAFLEVTQELVRRGQRVVFATRSTSKSLATIPLARAADRVILCVSLGSTSIRVVEETIEQIGKERFLGSMLVGEPSRGRRAPRPWSSAEGRLEQQGS
jgi:UDP:flavonoid glycosyltransferase YjiC (YdhE family)